MHHPTDWITHTTAFVTPVVGREGGDIDGLKEARSLAALH